MKHTINLILFLFFSSYLVGQSVDVKREADLMPEDYSITGSASLEQLSDGTLRLVLSDNFTTPRGPDVRIILNTSISGSGGVEVVNLSDINHFNGSLSIDLDASIALEDYDHIVFYCVAFQQLWASGTFGEPINLSLAECNTSIVENAMGSNSIDICTSDNTDDIVFFQNSLNLPAGSEYAYLITDENEILQEVILSDQNNFSGTDNNVQRVYGINYSGSLNPIIGSHRLSTTAAECFEHSSDDTFITITKNGCEEPFICMDSGTTTAEGDNIDICPSDDLNDIIVFSNSLNLSAGESYVYLITDANEILEEVVFENLYNFEGSTDTEQRVYGLHYNGTLNIAIGSHRSQTVASDCFQHSSGNTFISITKNGCEASFMCMSSETTSTEGSNLNICPTDNQSDFVRFNNSLNLSAGQEYVYLITDINEILEEIVFENFYNFEGSGPEEKRVYGLHYSGTLDVKIGLQRNLTTSSECFEHSSSTSFLTITKNACEPDYECMESLTATTDWATEVDICPDDEEDDLVNLRNNLFIEPGEHYAYLITDPLGILQAVSLDSVYNFSSSGLETQRVYGIHFDGQLIPSIGEDRKMTTATGCFTHSGDDLFLTITKNACEAAFECMESLTATTNWETNVDICPTDEIPDAIPLRNNLFLEPGEHYAYLITDTLGILQEVSTDSIYNFEGSGLDEQRVYGIHFDGTLAPMIGQDRLMTTASGCYVHSGDNLFLTITKSACEDAFECVESLTATTAWVTEVDICSTDGEDDYVFLQNNIGTMPGENYAFLLTDEFETLQEVILDTTYNFENTGAEEQRVYGISYSGELLPLIGENRKNTTASECYIHSGDDLFIRINKTASCTSLVSDLSLADNINIYPNPSSGNFNIDLESSTVKFDKVSIYNMDGRLIKYRNNLNQNETFNIDIPGFYVMRFENNETSTVKRMVVQ